MAWMAKVRGKHALRGRGYVLSVEVLIGEPKEGDMLNEYMHCRVVSTFNKKITKVKDKKAHKFCDIMVAGHGKENIDVGNVITGGEPVGGRRHTSAVSGR